MQRPQIMPGVEVVRERPGFFARQPRARMTNAAASHVNLFAGRHTSRCPSGPLGSKHERREKEASSVRLMRNLIASPTTTTDHERLAR